MRPSRASLTGPKSAPTRRLPSEPHLSERGRTGTVRLLPTHTICQQLTPYCPWFVDDSFRPDSGPQKWRETVRALTILALVAALALLTAGCAATRTTAADKTA